MRNTCTLPTGGCLGPPFFFCFSVSLLDFLLGSDSDHHFCLYLVTWSLTSSYSAWFNPLAPFFLNSNLLFTLFHILDHIPGIYVLSLLILHPP